MHKMAHHKLDVGASQREFLVLDVWVAREALSDSSVGERRARQRHKVVHAGRKCRRVGREAEHVGLSGEWGTDRRVEATRTETTLLTAWVRMRTADQVKPELKREMQATPLVISMRTGRRS
jgi:hypothetical protein